MYNPVYVSNNFLIRSFREYKPITAMKLQKMLYFLYRDYLQETCKYLFTERFSTWKYGPVLESVYDTFKDFKTNNITKYGGIPAYSINEKKDISLKKLIDDIWDKCRTHNGIYLSKLTHKEGGAWLCAWANNQPFLLDDDIMKDNILIE